MSRPRIVDRWPAAATSLVFLAVLWLAAPAVGQAAGWSIQSTPNGTEAEHSNLYDIACEPTSTNTCVAVGKQTKGGTSTPYAQGWNGTSWTNQATVVPSGATASELQAVHCVSKTSCVAAGSYVKSGTFSLVEAWNGTSWSIQTTPNPEGATETRLRGISCQVITACIAVGQSNAGGKWAIAMRGNSGAWSLHTIPKPAEAISSELTGVECTSATSCIAVGAFNTGASTFWAMAAVWNGTSWSLSTVPKPAEAGAKRSILLDISCSDGTNCTGVGGYLSSGSVQKTFIVRWNGASWSQQTSLNPAESTNSVLQNVSCADRYSCVAVGDWTKSGAWQPMAQYWNNTGWSLDSPANPAGASQTIVEGVACRVTCLATGWYTNSEGKDKTLGEVRSMPTWTQRELPEGASMRLHGTSCVEAAACVAVGEDISTSSARTFVWNGSAWSASGKPAPAGAGLSRLFDVSCTSSSACTAVGLYHNSEGFEKPYAARYASGVWTVQTVPLPAEVFRGKLTDVACASATSCRAVGERGSSKTEGDGRLIVAWNGLSWTVQATSKVEGVHLEGISCVSTSACMAVGEDAGFGGPFVEVWNGSSWSVIADPPNGSFLSSVSCLSSTDCTVAGWGEGGYPFASKWNGSTWSQLSQAPRLASTGFSLFQDISCTSATSCHAVGRASGGPGLLAADWNGTSWTLNDVPKPTGGELNGVSCLTSTSCHAVGGLGVAESLP